MTMLPQSTRLGPSQHSVRRLGILVSLLVLSQLHGAPGAPHASSAAQAPAQSEPRSTTIPVWLDVDTANGVGDVDDGLMMIQAFHSPELELRGVSVQFGNATLTEGLRIAQHLIDRYGPEGMQAAAGAASAHDLGRSTEAVRAMAAALRSAPMHILAVGPVTNLASLLQLHPELHDRVLSVVMVAARRPGQLFTVSDRQQAPFRDANFEKDVDAMRIVLATEVPIVFAPWEISNSVWLRPGDMERLRNSGGSGEWIAATSAYWMMGWQANLGVRGFTPFDTLAVAWFTDREHIESMPVSVDIEVGPDDGASPVPPRTAGDPKSFLVVRPPRSGGRSATYTWAAGPAVHASLIRRLAGRDGEAGAPEGPFWKGPDSALRLTDIQVVGSHNSYKRAMPEARMAMLRTVDAAVADSLDYEHPPLTAQLDHGLRNLELDLFWDPTGNLYPWPEGEVRSGGFRVQHVQNLDDQSHCSTLRACLGQMVLWSRQHPSHLPILVTVNAKDEFIDRQGFVRPLPFDAEAWDRLDSTLRDAVGELLIEPSDVFDLLASDLPNAERLSGPPRWPELDALRGRFVFVLDEGGAKRDAYAAEWWRRALFAHLDPGTPGAAILIRNDPVEQFEDIQRRVLEGYLVRTRADADTAEARTGSTTRRDAAFRSGAQFVTTDYYLPSPFDSDYVVELPGGDVVRCSPVRSTPEAACAALRARTDN